MSYLLPYRDYTFYNALVWGNCAGHFRRANDARYSCCQRFFHGTLGFFEAFPIVGQIISLFEMAIAYLFRPSTLMIDLARKEIRRIEWRETPLPHQARAITPPVPPPAAVEVTLPSDPKDTAEALFPLHRHIESQYRALPWPVRMQKIVIFTKVQSGRGDIATAAKIISIMQRISPTLSFDWVLRIRNGQYDPESFLHFYSSDPSKVHIRYLPSRSPQPRETADFLLIGPIRPTSSLSQIEDNVSRDIRGPSLCFTENAKELTFSFKQRYMQREIAKAPAGTHLDEIYRTLHPEIFPPTSDHDASLPMGLQPGSGVSLDRSRLEAPLSRGYCCPSYLLSLQDRGLREDILEAMNVFDGQSTPDYDQYSLNFGYAHWPASWGKFIDCVAIHEKNKHVVIVLNQRGEFRRSHLSTQEFANQILTPERLALLKRKGYGDILFKGEELEAYLLQERGSLLERRLTIIIRPSFSVGDMRSLQLAAERLLATGDNSAAESWCARCKLYLYEDVANAGCKQRFLQQQVDLAQTISPSLSTLLAMFGRDRRHAAFPTMAFTPDQMIVAEKLLEDDPDLGDATLRFCDHIVSHYSFHSVLEGALKRAAWHHLMPEIARIESEALDPSFRSGLIEYVRNPRHRTLRVTGLSALGERLQKHVSQ